MLLNPLNSLRNIYTHLLHGLKPTHQIEGKMIQTTNQERKEKVAMSNSVIQTLKNGPYLVNGEIELQDADGKTIPTKDKPCALCRCGQSGKKPFCDGTHVKANFKG